MIRKMMAILFAAILAAAGPSLFAERPTSVPPNVTAWTSSLTGGSVFAFHDTKTSMPRSLFFNAVTGKPIDPKGDSLPSSVNVFGFQYKNDIILIDTGYGAFRSKLIKTSITEADVDYILLTHVHPDHVGGLLLENELAAFPKATIMLSEREAESLKVQTPRNAKIYQLWQKIRRVYDGRIKTFAYGAKDLPGGLEAVDAHGHTPGHTVFKRTDVLKKILNGEPGKEKQIVLKQDVWFIGDLVHGASVQFEDPDVCAKFDADPAAAAASRRKIFEKISQPQIVILEERNDMIPGIIFGAHLPFPGCGQILRKDTGFVYVGMELNDHSADSADSEEKE